MANRTMKYADTVKGTNPQYLVEKIIRTRIYESKYWKEECFALTAELLVDKAVALDHIGGVFAGNIKPTPFLCLSLKMLQIQPDKEIVVEFIKNDEYKYVRALGAFYLRLAGTAMDCYKYLEPLYNDYRKLKRRKRDGNFELVHMDEFVDELLHNERTCDVILPRIQRRYVLEQDERLEPRMSALEGDLDIESDEEEEEEEKKEPSSSKEDENRSNSPHRRQRHRSRSRSPRRHRRQSRSRSSDRHRRRRSRSRSRSPRRSRHRHRDDDDERRRRRRRRSRSPRARSRSRSAGDSDDGRRKKEKEKKKKNKKKKAADDDGGDEQREIREANELRAKLGLRPLKV
ncbi:pre-mRNA-splicing factor 38A-like [Oscarella lobularis]|uniref:pre-mRNA-splicing factor 38A-like n=1 Tax=Oscarella lobularis TaxID=121494 RepID=UPI0033141455